MKKILIFAAVVGAVAAIPLTSGYMAERENRRLTDLLNENSTGNTSVAITDYQRGYLSSDVAYEIALPDNLQMALGDQAPIKLSCHYRHGLLKVDYQCDLAENDFYTEFVEEYFAGDDPLRFTGSAGLSGSSQHLIEIDELSGSLPDGGTVSLQASKLQMQVDHSLTEIKFSGVLGDLEAIDTNGLLRMIGGEMDGSLTMIGEALYTGQTNVRVSSVGLKSGVQEMQMSGLVFNSDIREDGENLSMLAHYGIDSIIGASDAHQVEDLKVDLDLSNLDKQAMIEYQKWVQDMQAAMAELGDDPAALALSNTAEIMPIIDMALKQGLKLSLNAKGNVGGAPNSLGLTLELLKKLNSQELQFLIMDPDKAFEAIALRLSANFDQALIDGSPIGVAISQNPLIIRSGKSYASDLQLGPKSSLNGQAIKVSELIALLMSAGSPLPKPTQM